MKILELYSGTQSIGKEFRLKGHEVLSVELNDIFTSDEWKLEQLTMDIADLTKEIVLELLGKPDVIWASPMCTTYSMAASGANNRIKLTDGFLYPLSNKAQLHDVSLIRTLILIDQLSPTYYFIENPRAGMRNSYLMQRMNDQGRHTVTYCQYGYDYMKPTDLWTNHPNPRFKAPCKNGSPCHIAAPRGSRTGVQGLKGNMERSKIPPELCKHIVDICEKPEWIAEGQISLF
jgi:hypothetical protein